jgi:hypothetical protein
MTARTSNSPEASADRPVANTLLKKSTDFGFVKFVKKPRRKAAKGDR